MTKKPFQYPITTLALRRYFVAQVLPEGGVSRVTVRGGGSIGFGRHGVVIPVNQIENHIWRLTHQALAV